MTFFSRFVPLRSISLPALALAFAADTTTAQELPPAIQVDRLLLQAEEQIRDQRYETALATLHRILELGSQHGLQTPDEFWFKHAQVAMEAGSLAKASESVIRYLELTGQGGENYLQALELLNEIDKTEQQRVEAERQQAEAEQRQRAEEARLLEELFHRARSSQPDNVFRDCAACPVMVRVPPGSFMMGVSTAEDRLYSNWGGSWLDNAKPQHRVTIEYPFAVGAYEVTFAEWDACLRAGGCVDNYWNEEQSARGIHPVIYVSWQDAQEYVRWLSRETGEDYRLLTEAEWEYAARAGTQTAWYWSDSPREQCRYANGSDLSGVSGDMRELQARLGKCDDGYPDTAPVGSFPPNPFGLYDVSGNVREWTEDCWSATYSGAPSDGRAWQAGDCSRGVGRGGSYWDEMPTIRSASRRGLPRADPRSDLGFRVARTIR